MRRALYCAQRAQAAIRCDQGAKLARWDLDVALKTARDRRDAARKLVASGVNPAAVKRAEHGNTFQLIAFEWLCKQQYAPVTLKKAEWIFRDLLLPFIGSRPVAQIAAPEILEVLRNSGLEIL
jgi:hypothetical protein